jgi:hypothetical protein
MELVPHLQHFVATYGYFAVFLIVAMESAGIPMPGETVLVTAAIFAASGTLKIYWVIGAAAAGAILGDNCGYWIGRELGFRLGIYRYGHYIRLDESGSKSANISSSGTAERSSFSAACCGAARLCGILGGRQSLQLGGVLSLQCGGRDRLGDDLWRRRLPARPRL